jgi:hypothetical protein
MILVRRVLDLLPSIFFGSFAFRPIFFHFLHHHLSIYHRNQYLFATTLLKFGIAHIQSIHFSKFFHPIKTKGYSCQNNIAHSKHEPYSEKEYHHHHHHLVAFFIVMGDGCSGYKKMVKNRANTWRQFRSKTSSSLACFVVVVVVVVNKSKRLQTITTNTIITSSSPWSSSFLKTQQRRTSFRSSTSRYACDGEDL